MSEASVVSVERLPSTIIIRVLPAELRKVEVDAICGAIDTELLAAPALPFILELSRVAFMGSAAMGVLIGLNQEFRNRAQRLIFASLQPNVLQSITITRMNKLMEFAPELEAAKKNAASGSAPQQPGPAGGEDRKS